MSHPVDNWNLSPFVAISMGLHFLTLIGLGIWIALTPKTMVTQSTGVDAERVQGLLNRMAGGSFGNSKPEDAIPSAPPVAEDPQLSAVELETPEIEPPPAVIPNTAPAPKVVLPRVPRRRTTFPNKVRRAPTTRSQLRSQGGSGTGSGSGVGGGVGSGNQTGIQTRGQGYLSISDIEQALAKRRKQLQNCYQKQLKRTPNAAGTILLEWQVARNGRVLRAKIRRTEMPDTRLNECVLDEVYQLRFPRPRGGEVVVSFPLIFSRKSF